MLKPKDNDRIGKEVLLGLILARGEYGMALTAEEGAIQIIGEIKAYKYKDSLF